MAQANPKPARSGRRTFATLGRLLMRLVLREQGSPAYAASEGELCEAVQAVVGCHLRRKFPNVDGDDLDELCFQLMLRWRDGRLTGFAPEFVKQRLFDEWRKKRPGLLKSENEVHARGRSPAEECLMTEQLRQTQEMAERFRASLKESQQLVLSCWIEDGEWGWKGRAASRLGRSGSWVTTQVGEISNKLKEDFDVVDAEAFVEFLRPVRTAGLVAAAELEEAPAEDEEPTPGRSEVLRDRLWACYAEGTLERGYMDRMARGEFLRAGFQTDEEELQRCYPAENALLDSLQWMYRELGRQLRAETVVAVEPAPDGGERE